jgi:hypothetical protein
MSRFNSQAPQTKVARVRRDHIDAAPTQQIDALPQPSLSKLSEYRVAQPGLVFMEIIHVFFRRGTFLRFHQESFKNVVRNRLQEGKA